MKAPLLQGNFTEALLQICRLPFKKNGLARLAEVVELKATALHSLGMDGVRADICAIIPGIYAYIIVCKLIIIK